MIAPYLRWLIDGLRRMKERLCLQSKIHAVILNLFLLNLVV